MLKLRSSFSAILRTFLILVKRSISVENRPRSGRFCSRSVEVGQVEKNRPTLNTNAKAQKRLKKTHKIFCYDNFKIYKLATSLDDKVT